MTLPLDAAHTAPRSRSAGTTVHPALSSPVARAALVVALGVGIAGDALLRGGDGLAWPLFVLIAALGMVALTQRAGRAVSTEAAGWLVAAVLFATLRTWRDSDTLQPLDILATLGAFGMSAVALGIPTGGLFAPRLRDTIWAGLATLRTGAAGVLPLALQELFAPSIGASPARRARPLLRAGIVALVVLVPFAALLRGADPIFASLVTLPDIDVDTIVSHLVVIGIITWMVGGWARAALPVNRPHAGAPESLPFSLGLLDVTAALGVLDLLFALFVASQLGWLFGGERFLAERTGLTAAEYARGGFFQLVLVVMLVVPVLLATRAALQPGDERLVRRHTALALPMIGLLAAMIGSSALRLRLYVHYFGLTSDRVYALVFVGWLGLVLVWLALTVLRGRGERWVAGAVISAGVVLVALHAVSVDAIVARTNIARAAEAPRDARTTLDLTHLARLSGDASPLAMAAVLAPPAAGTARGTASVPSDRCIAAATLLRRWGPTSRAAVQRGGEASWRSWNRGESIALATVAANVRALRAVRHAECAGSAQAQRWRDPTNE